MRKLVLCLFAGTGTDAYEAYLVPETMSQTELDDFAWERAVDHAAMYGIYEPCEDDEDDEYSHDWDHVSGHWEEYDPGTYDSRLIYGNNNTFEWNEI